MPSPAANALTVAHQAQQQQISREVALLVLRAWGVIDPADIDRLWPMVARAIAQVVSNGHARSTAAAGAYLQAHARLDGVNLRQIHAPGEMNADRLDTALRVTGPVALKRAAALGQSPQTAAATALVQITGAATRLALAGGRQTIQQTVRRSGQIVGYRRVTVGKTCPFCTMLASRGAVYKSEKTAGDEGNAYHDHCNCTSEPLYRQEPEPPEVVELYERWQQVTAGLSGKDALNAWRAALTG